MSQSMNRRQAMLAGGCRSPKNCAQPSLGHMRVTGNNAQKYARGGAVNPLKQDAQRLRKMGREGDTDLVHVNAHEKQMLKAAGGRGSVNPRTGLREYPPKYPDKPKRTYRSRYRKDTIFQEDREREKEEYKAKMTEYHDKKREIKREWKEKKLLKKRLPSPSPSSSSLSDYMDQGFKTKHIRNFTTEGALLESAKDMARSRMGQGSNPSASTLAALTPSDRKSMKHQIKNEGNQRDLMSGRGIEVKIPNSHMVTVKGTGNAYKNSPDSNNTLILKTSKESSKMNKHGKDYYKVDHLHGIKPEGNKINISGGSTKL